MLAAAFVAGMVLSFALAWQGLFGTGLKFSASRTLTGTTARVIGGLCALFGLALAAGVLWVVLQMMSDRR